LEEGLLEIPEGCQLLIVNHLQSADIRLNFRNINQANGTRVGLISSIFQRGVDQLGAGFGFVHADKTREGCLNQNPIKKSRRGKYGISI
jgi:hypothetical protein